MSKNYAYKILKEEVEIEDFYEFQTHEKIKNSILNLIKNENEGITIGLSGHWGSGKSTIINLLKNDKEADHLFTFFYFDAWAHEGDPLRRIFLESLINSFKENGYDGAVIKELEEKRKIISREKITKHIKVTRSSTLLGLLLTVATLFFTIGLAVLSSINYDNLTLDNKYPVNWAFVTGTILITLPFVILLGNLIWLLLKEEKISDLNNWSFLQNNSDETITEDVVGDDERSSIEFERYFKEILTIYNKSKSKKIIIVLDNLDRIEADVSLKIWSTLQTFIQHKNPSSRDYETFKNIFTIIPYDEESLKKIWINYTKDEEGKDIIDKKFSSSFFDKSFQIRIDVPKPIISNWLDFIKKMVEKAFESWKIKDKEVIVEVIEKTRKNILDSPKPRELKTYLNQIGFIRNHVHDEISTKSIAFYTFKRYLQGFSNDEIAAYLLDKDGIPKEEINLIEDETIQEIAAIIYGVDKVDGAQILLSPKILEALSNDDPLELENLISTFKQVFWTIFKKNISDTNKLGELLKYSSPLNKLSNSNQDQIELNYLPILNNYLKSETDYNYVFDSIFVKDINSTSALFFKSSRLECIKLLWLFFINVYKNHDFKNLGVLTIDEDTNKIFVETLSKIYQETKIDFKIETLNISFKNWKSINLLNEFLEISKLIHPTKEIILEISKLISPGTSIDDDTFILTNNLINSEVKNLEPILLQLEVHFKWNNGSQSGNIFTFKSIELLESLFYKYHSYDYSKTIQSSEIFSVCHYLNPENEEILKIMSTLCAVNFKEKVSQIEETFTVSNTYATHFLLLIKGYWSTPNNDNALYTYEKFKKYNLLNIVWELCKNKDNLLCLEIINLMIANDDNSFFIVQQPFDKLVDINELESGNFEISTVINKLQEFSKLEEDILQTDDLNIISNDYLISEIITSINSDKIFKKVETEMNNLDDNILIKSLISDDHLFNILIKLKSNNKAFKLDILNDVLFDFVKGLFLKNNPLYELKEWKKNNWKEIIELLDETHLQNFSNRITKLIVDEKENLSTEFYTLNSNFIDRYFLAELVNKDIKIFILYIQDALQNPTVIENLIFIENLLNLDNEKKIKFDSSFKKLIKDNVISLNSVGNSEELIRISSVIAIRLSISLN
jgi:hypothetical protein